MKKLFLTLCVAILLIGCSNEKKQSWEFNNKNQVKNQGFKFDKKDYSSSSKSNKSNVHPGCSASCCSKK